jgi:hypothetical protein
VFLLKNEKNVYIHETKTVLSFNFKQCLPKIGKEEIFISYSQFISVTHWGTGNFRQW